MLISGQPINNRDTIKLHSSSMANWRRVRKRSKEQHVNQQQNYLGWSSIVGAEGSDVSKDELRSKKRNILMTGNYFLYYSFPDTGRTCMTDRSLIPTWTKHKRRIQGRVRTCTGGGRTIRFYLSISASYDSLLSLQDWIWNGWYSFAIIISTLVQPTKFVDRKSVV